MSNLNVRILPKLWTGPTSTTAIGAVVEHSPFHESSKVKELTNQSLNTHSEERSMEIVYQNGQHLEMRWKSPRHEDLLIGILSTDGTQLQVASRYAQALFIIKGNAMTGSGVSRGSGGTFEDWSDHFSVWTADFTAVEAG